MDENTVEESAIGIDVVIPIDHSDNIVPYDETERTDGEFGDEITVSGSAIGTGNLIGQVFKLIASFREKTYWELDNKEIKSLNTTCPKILPKIVREHSGIIQCILSLLGIITKRLKRERLENQSNLESQLEQQDIEKDVVSEQAGLTGGRNG